MMVAGSCLLRTLRSSGEKPAFEYAPLSHVNWRTDCCRPVLSSSLSSFVKLLNIFIHLIIHLLKFSVLCILSKVHSLQMAAEENAALRSKFELLKGAEQHKNTLIEVGKRLQS